MFDIFGRKSWPYSWKEDPYEPNLFYIYKKKDWFMKIQFNGEYPVSYQKQKMIDLVHKLNKGK